MKVSKRRLNKTIIRPSPEQYFSDITKSKEAAIKFIINNMAVYSRLETLHDSLEKLNNTFSQFMQHKNKKLIYAKLSGKINFI